MEDESSEIHLWTMYKFRLPKSPELLEEAIEIIKTIRGKIAESTDVVYAGYQGMTMQLTYKEKLIPT